MKKSGGGFKRPSFSKPSSSMKRPSSFKSGFKLGGKAPDVQGGVKENVTFGDAGQRTSGWRSRPRGGCLGGLVALVLILICVGVIVVLALSTSVFQTIFGG
jgi:hypothetical protein